MTTSHDVINGYIERIAALEAQRNTLLDLLHAAVDDCQTVLEEYENLYYEKYRFDRLVHQRELVAKIEAALAAGRE